MTSDIFIADKARASQEESKEHLDQQVDIVKLLLFGLLYCKGSHTEKCMRFWDVLQQPGLDQISW